MEASGDSAESATEKKEEASGHSPPKATGHAAGPGPQRSPEQEALAARIQEHQQAAARLSHTEEVRNLMQYSTGFGVLSTNSRTLEGYPSGSVVGFSLDDKGRPLFAFSSMSAHTGDLAADSRVSLTVTAATFKGAADGRVSLIGDVNKVPEEDLPSVREMYKKKHPNAYWVDFGDFRLMRMDTIKAMRFVGGFAMAGDVNPEDYLTTAPDAVAEFSAPISKHMNDDHSDTTRAMIAHFITGGVEVTSAQITAVDRLGMYVLVGMPDGQSGKLRLPFPRPAESRKDVKTLIVEMTQAAMAK
ncbi:conserved unknown protein [Ectocarpus siliculosus]|uniref:Uncharacterized protein n=1 Tax=Ectocarpus siliculosus TaxID=2880 RepID=D7FZW7_ECTSI|nr:conserved unknown protein [Ectocarpus siliculosus]|eukprot:CBJ48592.1 conserved unknown protein [Ectocarpus siliculosus]